MWERWFRLRENDTTVRTELIAGCVTFLTMAYIIFVQPAVLSGRFFGELRTGMDFGAVTTATCLSAALATAVMGLYARYPIAQAPGMGENFFFVLTTIPAAAALVGQEHAWQVALGVVFYSGVLFLLLTLTGVRETILDSLSPSLKNAIAAGIGLFIAFIGLQNAGLVLKDPGTGVKLNPHFNSPDLVVFFFGLLLSAVLHARRVPGSMLWGIVGSTLLAVALHASMPHLPPAISEATVVTESKLMTQFQVATAVVSAPPSLAPVAFQMDLTNSLAAPMLPFIGVFLFMVLFDTVGTLVGVGEQAGFIENNKLPRANRAMLSDAVGTVVGATLGTSTVTSFIESAAGVEQGGRTGLTALTVAALFLVAPFFSPLVAMVGSYAPITAPALVIVGSMMIRNVTKIDWSDAGEAMPAFLTLIGIPLSYSIADGLALGLLSYPIIKLASGARRDVHWMSIVLALLVAAYFVFLRAGMG